MPSKRTGIMLARPYEERLLKDWPKPYIVQPKLDGLRCLASWDGMQVTLHSSQQTEIMSVPHIVKAMETFCRKGNYSLPRVFDGELYVHGMPFETLCSRVKRLLPKPGSEEVEYHIFDMKGSLDQDNRSFLLERASVLGGDLYGGPIKVVENSYIQREEELSAALARYMSEGYEGIILRNPKGFYEEKRSPNLLKLKPTKVDAYKIIGVEEEISIHGERKNRLGSFLCEGADGLTFSVGSGLNAADRERYWQGPPVGKTLLVRYQALTDRGVPRFPIYLDVLERA